MKDAVQLAPHNSFSVKDLPPGCSFAGAFGKGILRLASYFTKSAQMVENKEFWFALRLWCSTFLGVKKYFIHLPPAVSKSIPRSVCVCARVCIIPSGVLPDSNKQCMQHLHHQRRTGRPGRRTDTKSVHRASQEQRVSMFSCTHAATLQLSAFSLIRQQHFTFVVCSVVMSYSTL